MKLNIQIDAEAKEPELVITTAYMTGEVNRVVEFVSGLDDVSTILCGIRKDKVDLLDQEAIVKIYAEDGKVFAKTDEGSYQMRLRLYEAEEIFIRMWRYGWTRVPGDCDSRESPEAWREKHFVCRSQGFDGIQTGWTAF